MIGCRILTLPFFWPPAQWLPVPASFAKAIVQGNRHWPKYQGAAARTWLAAREADLMPVGYFHVVFTLPAQIAEIAFQNKVAVYDLLFRTTSETMMTIAADPRSIGGARAGGVSPCIPPGTTARMPSTPARNGLS